MDRWGSKPTNLLMNILLSEKKVVNENALPIKYNALNNFSDVSLRRAFFSVFQARRCIKSQNSYVVNFRKIFLKTQSSYIPKDNSVSDAVTSDFDTR